MIDAADEGLHLQECDPQKNWMENMCFFGFDEAADAGFLIHVKHRPNEDIVEFRFGAKIGGQSCSYGVVHPINGTLAYPEFQLACWEPDRLWTITGQGQGWPIEAVGGVMGLPASRAAPLAFSIDLEWSATIPSVHWGVIHDESTSAPGGAHYDQGGRFTGTIRIGDAEARVDALAYRDHSWGPRNFMQMKCVRYMAFVSADMRTYYDGLLMDHGDRQTGFSYTVEDGVGRRGPTPHYEVLEGEDWDNAYRKIAYTVDGRRYVATTIWNLMLPLVPERYLSNVAMVRMDLPDGGTGFGIVERGRLFGDDDLNRWQSAARAPAA